MSEPHMNVKITSGDRRYEIEISDKAHIEILKPVGLEVLGDIRSALAKALDNPEGTGCIQALVDGTSPRRVALGVTDDVVPEYLEILLPNILDSVLCACPDLAPSQVTIITRKGDGRLPGAEKFKSILRREAARGFRVISHDPVLSRLADFGSTKRGIPVQINADFAQADLKLLIGQLYPHQLVGFTGGATAAASGCAGTETLEAMNRLMLDESCTLGCLERQPLREELAEAFDLAGIDLVLGLILDPDKQPVRILANAPDKVLRTAAGICSDYFGVAVDSRFDIVLAATGRTSGGDIPHHLRKALLTVSQVVKEGGKVLVLTGCSQGMGDDIYFEYVCQSLCPESLMEAFRKSGLKLCPGDAHLLEQVLIDKEMDLAVGFDLEIAGKCQFRATDPTTLISEWVDGFEGSPRVAVILDGKTMCCFTG